MLVLVSEKRNEREIAIDRNAIITMETATDRKKITMTREIASGARKISLTAGTTTDRRSVNKH